MYLRDILLSDGIRWGLASVAKYSVSQRGGGKRIVNLKKTWVAVSNKSLSPDNNFFYMNFFYTGPPLKS